MIPFPPKKYDIIYADPPWAYRCKPYHVTESGKGYAHKGCSDHYNTMSDDDIAKLPIDEICEKNCLLFLWTTGPQLEIGIKILKAWGFDYITMGFVWDKIRCNPGAYTMSECEFCFIGKRGSIPGPRGARNIRQFLSERRTYHSKKPDEIRLRIEKMFPTQKKIELFARQKSPGWDVWGNEV